MKKLTLIFAILLPILMGACTSDGFDNPNVSEGNEVSVIEAIMTPFGDVQSESRTAIDMSDSKVNSLVWAEGDTIGIYPSAGGDQLSFPITDGIGTGTCIFTGGGWALKTSTDTETYKYTAYSPFNRKYYLLNDNTALPIKMLGQKQDGNDNSKHLGAYHIQIASGETPTSGKISFKFKHKVSFVRMDITAPCAATWKSIELESDAAFTTKATMNLSLDVPTVTPTAQSNSVTLELENVKTTESNLSIVAYMMMLPVDFNDKTLTMKLTDVDDNVYFASVEIRNPNNAVNPRLFGEATSRWISANFYHPNNQIWYTSSDGEIIIPNYCPEHSNETFGANMLSNTYENGKGIITFDNVVTKIGDANVAADFAFYNCSTLTSITIPNSVTEIGVSSFEGCSSLTSITIPKNVTQINGSFGNNSSLSSIVVEEGNPVYDSRNNCHAIIETTTNTLIVGCKNTVIPNSVTTIGTNSFSGCNSLRNITIPNSVTTIGLLAFNACSSLESVEIPSSVTEIKMWAFRDCSSLKKVNVKAIVPPHITAGTFLNNNGIDCYVPAESIDDYKAADYWKDLNILSEVTIPNNEIWYTSSNNSVVVPKIKNVFGANIISNVNENGKGIITFDSDVTEIGEGAFQDCSYLTSITIPQSVTKIGSQVFANCIGLTKITVDESNPIYDSRNNCNAIIETATNTLIQGCNNTIIPNTVTAIGQDAFYYCTTLTNITIPNSVTKIGSVAFQGCESLQSITIPSNVTEIGTGGIGCTSLNNIIVDENNPVYDSRNNCNAIIETATNTLIQGCNNTIIPNTVTEIGEVAFAASKITSITIPNSVKKIGLGAFFYCTRLSNITIPNSVTTIGEDAFSDCYALSEVHVEAINPPKLLNNSVFYSDEIKMYVPSESIDIYRATEYWKEFVLLAE